MGAASAEYCTVRSGRGAALSLHLGTWQCLMCYMLRNGVW